MRSQHDTIASHPTLSDISAEILGSPRARGLREAIERGELPAYRVGRTIRVSRAEALAWLHRQRVRPRHVAHASAVVAARLERESARR